MAENFLQLDNGSEDHVDYCTAISLQIRLLLLKYVSGNVNDDIKQVLRRSSF